MMRVKQPRARRRAVRVPGTRYNSSSISSHLRHVRTQKRRGRFTRCGCVLLALSGSPGLSLRARAIITCDDL